MSWRVYAVVADGGRTRVRGADGEPLQAIRAGRVHAIVGRSPRPARVSATSLRRHDRVVRALWAAWPAMLPARFGSSFVSLDELAQVLTAQAAPLRRGLSRVRGRAQMTVRVLPEPATASAAARTTGRTRTAAAARSGTQYLRALAAAEAGQRNAAGVAPVRAAVRRFVRAEAIDRRDAVTSVYHLVPRGSVAAYRRAAEKAAAAAGARVIVTGPHPPYAFADGR